MDSTAHTPKARSLVRTVLVCLGYGFLMSTYTGVPMGASYLPGWQETIFSQFTFYVGIALGCLALRTLNRRLSMPLPAVVGAVTYAAVTVLCLVSERAIGSPLYAGVFSLAAGFAAGIPLLFWYDRMLEECRSLGRKRCIMLLGALRWSPPRSSCCWASCCRASRTRGYT